MLAVRRQARSSLRLAAGRASIAWQKAEASVSIARENRVTRHLAKLAGRPGGLWPGRPSCHTLSRDMRLEGQPAGSYEGSRWFCKVHSAGEFRMVRSLQADQFPASHPSGLDHDSGGEFGEAAFDLRLCGVSAEKIMHLAHCPRAAFEGFENLGSFGAKKVVGEDVGGAGFAVAPEGKSGFQVWVGDERRLIQQGKE